MAVSSLDVYLTPTPTAMSGGAAAIAGSGFATTLTFAGTWAVGDTLTITMVTSNPAAVAPAGSTGQPTTVASAGVSYIFGFGNVSNITPTYCLTYGNKVYVLAGTNVYFSAVGDATTFNNPSAIGNGFITLSNWTNTSENLTSMAPYQGRMAFFSRNTTWIYSVPSDPTQWQFQQVLPNIGCVAPLSAQPLGDLDVVFLSDSGIRSLRVRDSSLNAVVSDLGSPVDSLVQASLLGSPSTASTAAGISDPTSGRYWCFVPDTSLFKIYVLSYYPSNNIIAWSTYDCTDNTGGTFTPKKFVVYKGQVFCRGTSTSDGKDYLYVYGDINGTTYDSSTVATATIPFVDAQSPGTVKMMRGFNVACACDTGTKWTFTGTTDWQGGKYDTNALYSGQNSSFDTGLVPWTGQGTHFAIKAVSSGAGKATLSQMMVHYKPTGQA